MSGAGGLKANSFVDYALQFAQNRLINGLDSPNRSRRGRTIGFDRPRRVGLAMGDDCGRERVSRPVRRLDQVLLYVPEIFMYG